MRRSCRPGAFSGAALFALADEGRAEIPHVEGQEPEAAEATGEIPPQLEGEGLAETIAAAVVAALKPADSPSEVSTNTEGQFAMPNPPSCRAG